MEFSKYAPICTNGFLGKLCGSDNGHLGVLPDITTIDLLLYSIYT
jgi:hypothetical protein